MPILVALLFTAAALAQTPPGRGQALFTEHCAVCHGAAGDGGSGPDLTNPAWQGETSDEALDRIIRQGTPGAAMPAFAEKLDAAARQAVLRHLRTLSEQAMQPTTGLHAPRIDVPAARLLRAGQDPANWLHYGRDYGHQRFSPLQQITRENVRNLVPLWSFQTGTPDGLQATPLVVDGILYLATSWNHVFAIDARTGAELWHHRRRLPEKMKFCCGPVNRGVAIRGGLLYMGTLDAHLVALDARTGRVRWDVEIGRVEDNLSATPAPLVVGDKVLIGIAGGDYPSRGFLDAYHAETGRRLWRFYTVPEPTGGAATWMTGSYDPELSLVYWGTGNPYPDYDGDAREGDNLYADSVVALDADTGRLKWHYQFTPHDVWDYDGVNEMLLANLTFEGRPVKALLHADRNGHFYALDRATGRFLYAKPFVRVTWATGFTPEGRPLVNPAAIPTYEGVTVCPGAAGGKEWNAMSYSPVTGLVYVPAIENCAVFSNYGVQARCQNLPPRPSGFRYLPGQAYGKMMAVRAATGETVWEVRTRTPLGGGVLATAGGLVFTGDAEGNFVAHDASDGRILWSFQTGSGIRAAPITFQLDGRQYIAIASGMAGAVRGYTGAGAPWMKNFRAGDTLYVFTLFEPGASQVFHGGAKIP